MTDIKRDVIRKSIQSKGFRERRKDKRHEKHYLFYKNKWYTHIYVMLSRGSSYKTYPKPLWKRMKDRLYLDSIEELEQFLKCPMTYEKYLSKLRGKEQIP